MRQSNKKMVNPYKYKKITRTKKQFLKKVITLLLFQQKFVEYARTYTHLNKFHQKITNSKMNEKEI